MVPRSTARDVVVPLLALVLLLIGGLGERSAAGSAAQRKRLSVEDIYGYGSRNFSGSFAAAMTWAPEGGPWIGDAEYLWPDFERGSWMRVDAKSGSAQPLVTSAQIQSGLRGAGASAEDAAQAVRQLPSNFSVRRDTMLLNASGDLFRYDIQ